MTGLPAQFDLLLPAIAAGTLACTMLGGLFAMRFRDKLHLILGFSAGAVIGVAFFDLMPEAVALNSVRFGGGSVAQVIGCGFLAYLLLDRLTTFHSQAVKLDDHGHAHAHNPERRNGVLGAASLTIHSFLDGAAIGLAFQASPAIGATVAFAVLAHDFSDGINTVNMIIKNGGPRRQALSWLAADALAPVLGIASTYFIRLQPAQLGMVLSAFCGFFLYIGASDLLPESYHRHSTLWTTFSTLVGAAVIYVAVHFARF